MKNRRNILLMMLIAIGISSYAQKTKQPKQELVIVGGKVLSPEDSIKVVQLYYSGLNTFPPTITSSCLGCLVFCA
jgi:hypothetical protein